MLVRIARPGQGETAPATPGAAVRLAARVPAGPPEWPVSAPP